MYGPLCWHAYNHDPGGFKKLMWYGIVTEFKCKAASTWVKVWKGVFHDPCHVPRPRLNKGCLDVHAGQQHCRSHHTPMPQHGSSVLPFPMLLQYIGCHYLLVLTTCSIQESTCSFFQISGSLPSSKRRLKHTRCVPRRKYRYERNGLVAPPPFLWLCMRLLQEDHFHHFPRTWRLHLTHEAFLEAPCNCADLLQGQLFDHLAHDCIFRSVDFDVAHLGPCLQHWVHCALHYALPLRTVDLLSF